MSRIALLALLIGCNGVLLMVGALALHDLLEGRGDWGDVARLLIDGVAATWLFRRIQVRFHALRGDTDE